MSNPTISIRLRPSPYHTAKELSYRAEVNGRQFELWAGRKYRNARPGRGARLHAYTYYTACIVERFADGRGEIRVSSFSIYRAPKAKLAEALAKFLAEEKVDSGVDTAAQKPTSVAMDTNNAPAPKTLAQLMPVIPEILRAIGATAVGAHETAREDLQAAARLIREAEAILNDMAMPVTPSR